MTFVQTFGLADKTLHSLKTASVDSAQKRTTSVSFQQALDAD